MTENAEAAVLDVGGDGTVDRIWKRGSRSPVATIFIHAGAGYHSVTNEKVHLEACSEAARIGMKFLKSGAPAAEAVEAAIRSLEDKEITNAGFGSNLNMDGVVECDATIVDHLGRSGACGAVPGIKNPISLAKMILDTSNQPLSLRRVPPNILVGLGAKQFAEEHGMPPTRNEELVSKNARDRYIRWNEDLKRAEAKMMATPSQSCAWAETEAAGTPTPSEYEKVTLGTAPTPRRDHTSAILTGTWNEGQPDSPYRVGSPAATAENGSSSIHTSGQIKLPSNHGKNQEKSPLSFMTPFQGRDRHPPTKKPQVHHTQSDELTRLASAPQGAQHHDSSVDFESNNRPDWSYGMQVSVAKNVDASRMEVRAGGDGHEHVDDVITDTVGAIAIDTQGNIAAGSSSGGIGMKHSGRLGPAALVGIGTAVIPEDPNDEDLTSVAAVTSGTGEHMATSIASAKCAERLLTSSRRGPGGRSVEELDEQALMQAFIVDDFMGHPGVRNQTSPGAIGVMAVKKTRTAVYFYFAHNTDSFALASMSSVEREPNCVMSRLGQSGEVAQGARKVALV